MRALTLDFDRRELVEADVAEPAVRGGNQVLLRVIEAGVCGTDRELAAFSFGRPPEGSRFLVIGHEALCEVVSAGETVTRVRPGDLVVPAIRRSCEPACEACCRGRRDLCSTGAYRERGIFGEHGYFAEMAADDASDLWVVPPALADYAVLCEPLSVVEKAVGMALRLHEGGARRALVLGAGSIGLLTAMTLRLRGLSVDVVSAEARRSARAGLVEQAGAEYFTAPARPADIVIEAAGAPEAAMAGARALGVGGVMIVLGAHRTAGELPLVDLIVGSRVIAGSVNASPGSFDAAVEDLGRMPSHVLQQMIERMEFSGYSRSILGAAPDRPKVVHRIG